MPSGSKDIATRGIETRFSGENAAEMARRSAEVRRANSPIRKCLKNLATEALYGHPPVKNDTLKSVAKFFKIKVGEVTFAHVAIFKQATEMAKGDPGAFNLVAAYAGEKPAEKVEVITPDYAELEAAFNQEAPEADPGADPE